MRIALTCLWLLSIAQLVQADSVTGDPPYDWKPLDAIIGIAGELKEDVYTFTLPRTDLNVVVDGMEVPTAAGIASEFRFFRCSCGKIRVVGQFCCADYETNDVIDAIRAGAMLEVSNLGPMFSSDRPRIMVVRFQGEGDGPTLAKLLKAGLGWMGEARATTQPAVKNDASSKPQI